MRWIQRQKQGFGKLFHDAEGDNKADYRTADRLRDGSGSDHRDGRGKIVGLGKHEALLETCKAYQEIYDSQMKKEVIA